MGLPSEIAARDTCAFRLPTDRQPDNGHTENFRLSEESSSRSSRRGSELIKRFLAISVASQDREYALLRWQDQQARGLFLLRRERTLTQLSPQCESPEELIHYPASAVFPGLKSVLNLSTPSRHPLIRMALDHFGNPDIPVKLSAGKYVASSSDEIGCGKTTFMLLVRCEGREDKHLLHVEWQGMHRP